MRPAQDPKFHHDERFGGTGSEAAVEESNRERESERIRVAPSQVLPVTKLPSEAPPSGNLFVSGPALIWVRGTKYLI